MTDDDLERLERLAALHLSVSDIDMVSKVIDGGRPSPFELAAATRVGNALANHLMLGAAVPALVAEVRVLRSVTATARAEALADAARCCDESEAEATQLRERVPQDADEGNVRLHVSRTSWVNTARALASEIRALPGAKQP